MNFADSETIKKQNAEKIRVYNARIRELELAKNKMTMKDKGPIEGEQESKMLK